MSRNGRGPDPAQSGGVELPAINRSLMIVAAGLALVEPNDLDRPPRHAPGMDGVVFEDSRSPSSEIGMPRTWGEARPRKGVAHGPRHASGSVMRRRFLIPELSHPRIRNEAISDGGRSQFPRAEKTHSAATESEAFPEIRNEAKSERSPAWVGFAAGHGEGGSARRSPEQPQIPVGCASQARMDPPTRLVGCVDRDPERSPVSEGENEANPESGTKPSRRPAKANTSSSGSRKTDRIRCMRTRESIKTKGVRHNQRPGWWWP